MTAIQRRFALASGLAAQLHAKPAPAAPTVDPCTCVARRIRPEHCSDACAGTARLVWGGVLPALSVVADRIRELVREDIAGKPTLDASWLDELCVLAESAERHGGEIVALRDELERTQQALRIAQAQAEDRKNANDGLVAQSRLLHREVEMWKGDQLSAMEGQQYLRSLAEAAQKQRDQYSARVRELEERLEAEREHAAAETVALHGYVERLEEQTGGIG